MVTGDLLNTDTYRIRQPLFEGPLDIVGDVHGEIEALENLLARLGYAANGAHPDGRRLVFVGDLVDRGPDSPAVLRKVRDLVAAGRAQCIAGNHELNLLRGEEKHGNSWWTNPANAGEHTVAVTAADKAELTPFLAGLPLILERDDLRVVHACWRDKSLRALEGFDGPNVCIDELYNHYRGKVSEKLAGDRILSDMKKEWVREAPRLEDPDWTPVMLPYTAFVSEHAQMDNPVAVLTSGMEEVAAKPFWAGGKWRMVSRVKWWEDYNDATPVIMGHYWRRFDPDSDIGTGKYGPDLMAGYAHNEWMGKRRNVYCADFSVGARHMLRKQQRDLSVGKLAAVRVPEWEVLCDDGESWALGQPGA